MASNPRCPTAVNSLTEATGKGQRPRADSLPRPPRGLISTSREEEEEETKTKTMTMI